MTEAVLSHETDLPGFRALARTFLARGVRPDEIRWRVAGESGDLFAGQEEAEGHEATGKGTAAPPAVSVPKAFAETAARVIQHADPARFHLLYRLLWRIAREERRLMAIAVDEDVHRAHLLAKAVGRDSHKMKAFVRFRRVEAEGGERFVAWFEPAHYTLEATAPFFARRFTQMTWSILTPYRSAHWEKGELRFGPGAKRSAAPGGDPLEEVWRTYYASIFNPARLMPRAMRAEMPKKYWRNLPEASLIPELTASAHKRTRTMIEAGPSEPSQKGRVVMMAEEQQSSDREEAARAAAALPPERRFQALSEEAARCRACPLWKPATQTVFGEGPLDARIMLVGEQPGDQEDLEGRPFVGPAGAVLDRALGEAGLNRPSLYVTNAVKHFKFEPRGKRRLHKSPSAGEITACRFWLSSELDLVRPRVVVALGASAARSVLQRPVKVTAERGVPIPLADGQAIVTVHPSYLLRLRDKGAREDAFAAFVGDLREAAAMAA